MNEYKHAIVLFTGGVESLCTLLWAMQRRIKIRLLYITNLFPQNSPLELKSAEYFAANCKDYWGNHLHAWNPIASKTQALITHTISPKELTTLNQSQEDYVTKRYAYLAAFSVQIAVQLGCRTVLCQQAILDHVDVERFHQQTLIQFECPSSSTSSGETTEIKDSLRYVHDVLSRQNADQVWKWVYCCQRPASQQLLDEDDGLELGRLCRRCARCRQVRNFIVNNVDYFINQLMPEDNDLDRDTNPGSLKKRKVDYNNNIDANKEEVDEEMIFQ